MSKRVWCLYRVSTERQGSEDDIPMQKKACHDFVEKNGWVIENELVEKVSGFSTPLEERTKLAIIKHGASKRQFDVLLVYMSDRLGRDMQYTFYVQGLYQLGVQVFSVKEGELKSSEHQDALINFIRFWQSEGESRKNSMRVKDSFEQLNEEGNYVGGRNPFGYKLIDTGDKRNSKSNKTIKKLVIDEDESKIVKLIFSLVLDKAYGSGRIAQYLNDMGLTNRGNVWRHNTIIRMLRNTVYMGYKRFGVYAQVGGIKSKIRRGVARDEWKLQPFNPDLAIISESDFKRVQDIMDKRNVSGFGNTANPPEGYVPLKSNVLLSGLAVCGYCNHKTKTDYTNKKYTRKTDGQVTTSTVYRYKCPYAKSVPEGHIQRQWGAASIDKQVEEEVVEAISRLRLDAFADEKDNFDTSELDTRKIQLRELQVQFNEKDKAYKNSEAMFDKLMAVSPDKAMLLLDRMNTYASEKMEVMDKINNLQEELKEAEVTSNDLENLKYQLDNWVEKFTQVEDLDVKKAMLSQVLREVVIYKDKVLLRFNVAIERAMYQTEAIQELENPRTREQYKYMQRDEAIYYDKEQVSVVGFMSNSDTNRDTDTPLKDDDSFAAIDYRELMQQWENTKSIQFEYTISR